MLGKLIASVNQKKIGWFDIKTKFKSTLRSIVYNKFVTDLICSIIKSYMYFVYLTCKKEFVNLHKLLEAAQNKKALLVVFWHNRLMMIPFLTIKPRNLNPQYRFMTLASRHGDGRIVGRVMEKFGLISILGSTKSPKHSASKHPERGIPVSSLKQIFRGLKDGYSLGLTPDGPRGPNQKINGDILEIARVSGAAILSASYSCSRFKTLKTWDQFKIPLPFSKLCFYLDDKELSIDKNVDDKTMSQIKSDLELRITEIEKLSLAKVLGK